MERLLEQLQEAGLSERNPDGLMNAGQRAAAAAAGPAEVAIPPVVVSRRERRHAQESEHETDEPNAHEWLLDWAPG